MSEKYIKEAEGNMEKAVERLKGEFLKLKVGKASAAVIEDLMVDYYGTKTPLQQLASITTGGARFLTIQPYDKNSLKAIEKAISSSDLSLGCGVEKEVVKVTFPELTEERRQELAKVVGQKAEEIRIMVRSAREKVWKEVKDLEQAGQVTEDEKYKIQEGLDKLAGDFNTRIGEMEKNKEEEVTTV